MHARNIRPDSSCPQSRKVTQESKKPPPPYRTAPIIRMILFMLAVSSACTLQTSPTPEPTPTSVRAAPVKEGSTIRLYNLADDLNFLSLDNLDGPSNSSINFGPVAMGTVTAYHDANDIVDPVVILWSYNDALEISNSFDITADIQPGNNTFVLRFGGEGIVLEPYTGKADLPSEPSLEQIWMLVGPEKMPCDEKEDASRLCLQVKYAREDSWQPLAAAEIEESWRFEPGYEYEFLVFKFENRETGAIRYELNQWLSHRGVTLETMPTLEGTSWVFASAEGFSSDASQVFVAYITAEFAAGEVHGSGDCGDYTASYEEDVIAGEIKIGQLEFIESHCEEVHKQLHEIYFTNLSDVTTYNIRKHSLEMWGADSFLYFVTPAQYETARRALETSTPQGD